MRICKMCSHSWVTKEVVTDLNKLPTSVHQFKEEHRPSGFTKHKKANFKEPTFDTTALTNLRW
jgi:hypothetical protein